MHTVPKLIDFPRYNTKGSGENEILLGIFRVVRVYRFSLHVKLYLRNFDYFLKSVGPGRGPPNLNGELCVPRSVPLCPSANLATFPNQTHVSKRYICLRGI